MMPRAAAAGIQFGALLLAVAALPILTARAADRDPAHAITSELICPCSCGEVLSGCTCETGISMKGYVESELKGGKGKDQIVSALVAQYGEVIRGAPEPKGFNLIVWVAPFAATVAGFTFVVWILRRWVGRRALAPASLGISGAVTVGADGASGPAAPSGAAADLEALRARAEAELSRLRGA